MAIISPEAAKALALMPVPVTEEDTNPDKAYELQPFKYTKGDDKYTFQAYSINGSKGTVEAIPHAIHCQQVLDEIEDLGHLDKAKAFKKTLAGMALDYCKQVYNDLEAALRVQDTPADQRMAGTAIASFDYFIKTYCFKYGQKQSRYNQLEGIRHLSKPTTNAVSVQQWRCILYNKNKAVTYCKGAGDQREYNDDQMKRHFFNSMPRTWRESFTENGNNDLADCTLDYIVTYMTEAEGRSAAKDAENKAKQQLANNDPSKKRKYDKDRPEGSAPGGRAKRQKNYDARNRNNDKGRCKKCRHTPTISGRIVSLIRRTQTTSSMVTAMVPTTTAITTTATILIRIAKHTTTTSL